MTSQNDTTQNALRRVLARLLESIALVITASAAVVVFVAIPTDLAERAHVLPDWRIFIVVVFAIAPIIIAGGHAGICMVLSVTASELALMILKPDIKRPRFEAALATSLCTVAYLFVYLANRFNFH